MLIICSESQNHGDKELEDWATAQTCSAETDMAIAVAADSSRAQGAERVRRRKEMTASEIIRGCLGRYWRNRTRAAGEKVVDDDPKMRCLRTV